MTKAYDLPCYRHCSYNHLYHRTKSEVCLTDVHSYPIHPACSPRVGQRKNCNLSPGSSILPRCHQGSQHPLFCQQCMKCCCSSSLHVEAESNHPVDVSPVVTGNQLLLDVWFIVPKFSLTYNLKLMGSRVC